MNTLEVGNAIAARFSGLTASITTADGTLTEAIQIGPTTQLPNEIGIGPALLVFPPSGVLDVGVSKLRRDELDFPGELKQGIVSRAVERVQEGVSFHGFGTGIDKDFGSATAKAVRAFQGARGLNATGVVDRETWSVLTRPLRD